MENNDKKLNEHKQYNFNVVHPSDLGCLANSSMSDAITYADHLSTLLPDLLNYKKNIPWIPSSSFNAFSFDDSARITKLQKTISEQEDKIKELFDDLKKKEDEHSASEQTIMELKTVISDLKKSQDTLFLTCKVHHKATDLLLEDNSKLLQSFLEQKQQKSCVISIDMRRSTDLMLKASSHEDYANFITGLSEILKNIIINHYGVFDKFTGDGILAYFPDFYSGDDSVLKCILTAKECHKAFDDYYRDKRSLFNITMKTGLGIGIDYGDTTFVKINNDLTIVGIPVVYACRLSTAPYGHTFLNQKVVDKLKHDKFAINLKETEIDLKNEGISIVYELCFINDTKYKEPPWVHQDTTLSST